MPFDEYLYKKLSISFVLEASEFFTLIDYLEITLSVYVFLRIYTLYHLNSILLVFSYKGIIEYVVTHRNENEV